MVFGVCCKLGLVQLFAEEGEGERQIVMMMTMMTVMMMTIMMYLSLTMVGEVRAPS